MSPKMKSIQWFVRTALEALLAISILAKLFGVVSWSWWVVFTPFTIPLALALTLGLAKVLFDLVWS